VQQIQVLETRQGTQFPAMGHAAPAAFEVPMELLGYSLIGGDGFVWTDLFLRSTEKHQGAYKLSVELVETSGGQEVPRSEGVIPDRRWKAGDLYQARRLLRLDGVPPGQYSLRIVLQRAQAFSAPLPGDIAWVEAPLLVLPASEPATTVLEEDWIVAHTPSPLMP
jgi:hypothetical protein